MQPLKCLMLGKGFRPVRRNLIPPPELSKPDDVIEWTTVDLNPDCGPDLLFDLNRIEKGEKLPFPDETFDEIHMYEVMEHYGRQGDAVGFFTGMNELWRILKPAGWLFGTSPGMHSEWAWGDPGHTRIISPECLGYLDRRSYDALDKYPSTDYRRYIDPCWWLVSYDAEHTHHIYFSLMKEPVRVA